MWWGRKRVLLSLLCRYSKIKLTNASLPMLLVLQAAAGALTLHGGLTSHAAVVMRGMGKPTVTGLRNAVLDAKARTLTASMPTLAPRPAAASTPDSVAAPAPAPSVLQIKEGDVITIDGTTGMVFAGELETVPSGKDSNFQTVMRWADKYKRLHVLASVDSYPELLVAQGVGADGIGLFRTEHMFLQPDRADTFSLAILSNTKEERVSFLNKLQPLQQQDFLDMFRVMHWRQVTVRLLSAPLHEFLPDPKAPDFERQVSFLAQRIGQPTQESALLQRVLELQEANSMLGLRGSRTAILYPEIVEMQTKALAGKTELHVLRVL